MARSVALYTKDELQAAFALILPPGPAKAAADEWWAAFADNVNERGYWVYETNRGSPSLAPTNALAVGTRRLTPEEERAQDRQFWGRMSIEERRELLLRFSSFHLRLVGLLSDELFERMRKAEGLTPEQAETGRAQMERIVAAIQGEAR
jgi:hypothetical protein